jgi:hypothetical protein
MARRKSDFWVRARRAQEKLVAQFLNHPDVMLIDIGYVDENQIATEQIALRIHVHERWFQAKPDERVTFPEKIDEIRVVVIRGDYRPGKP